jgi:hypothetical protein
MSLRAIFERERIKFLSVVMPFSLQKIIVQLA